MMMKRIGLLLISILLGYSTANAAPGFLMPKRLVVFGDSYSDNGNTYAASGNTYPGAPYFAGHFSNGPTWSTYLAEELHIDAMNPNRFMNYAYGQAQIVGKVSFDTYNTNHSTYDWQFSVPDLQGEVDQYQHDVDAVTPRDLFVIFMGTNDMLNHVFTPNVQDSKRFVTHLIQTLKKNVHRLEKMGAKNIVIVNMRALQFSPLAHQLARQAVRAGSFEAEWGYKRALRQAIHQFNDQLRAWSQQDSKIRVFDANQFDTKRITAKEPFQYQFYRSHYKLTQVKYPCYVNHGNYIKQKTPVCQDPMHHFYFDRIHPTTMVHKQMAEALLRFLKRS